MSEPEGSFAKTVAREELLRSARRAAECGTDAEQWLLHEAPQWALDAVDERDVAVIREMAGWR